MTVEPEKPLVLYPFRYFDLPTRKWVKARYKATLDQLCDRHDCFQITGMPEKREGNGTTAGHVQRSFEGNG